jgi:hypothetical protein
VATTFDFAFALGPRINAAGRLSDMTLGIECLLTDDAARGEELAKTLDGINRERRDIEAGMREQAQLAADAMIDEDEEPPPAICDLRPGLPRRRGRHRRLARQGQAAPADLCVCRQPGAGQGARAQGLGPVHSGFSFARRAGPDDQAPPGRDAALWRPRDGGRLHHRRGTLSSFSSRRCSRWRRNGWTRPR